jgi:hypothetical protein
MFPATSKSFAFVVVADPLLLVVPFPELAATASRGFDAAIPLYSAMRMSAFVAAGENATVIVFAFAEAAAIFAA